MSFITEFSNCSKNNFQTCITNPRAIGSFSTAKHWPSLARYLNYDAVAHVPFLLSSALGHQTTTTTTMRVLVVFSRNTTNKHRHRDALDINRIENCIAKSSSFRHLHAFFCGPSDVILYPGRLEGTTILIQVISTATAPGYAPQNKYNMMGRRIVYTLQLRSQSKYPPPDQGGPTSAKSRLDVQIYMQRRGGRHPFMHCSAVPQFPSHPNNCLVFVSLARFQ